ncbi:MAG: hypothetical protein CFH15_00029 [Alphaproteobacteria bacterium MarineAlpha5_Bin5]|nr:MAG: hypothetical protein CFH15_00029 [Alphaproteobacteria bacterium MarineAlpha5_Bin5]PPR52465.1 MAG: hypothetical protein CFH14_00311 [Alphaproteobacteria bacterium MarineAlpha5_Bin4]|tara:strand:+ start:9885 stop:10145 length:261 start_codon:yes stop_codon:yes gene_type:complete
MIGFLALAAVLVTVVVMPTTAPFKIIDTQENAIKIQAFEKNFDKANLYAKSFCDEKGKIHKLNKQESRDYRIVKSLHDYKFDCTDK